jgi:serine protease SohB
MDWNSFGFLFLSFRINEYYSKDIMALQKAIDNERKGFKLPLLSSDSLSFDISNTESKKYNNTVILLDWTGPLDTSITSMESLRRQVSFVLSAYNAQKNPVKPDIEVVVLLESPGGSVMNYGLAGSHLLRLRNAPGITLTICVDKVAASGGYLLCCTASPGQLFAAPFAMIGSIGVIGQVINVHNFLEDKGIQPLVFRGGKDKAPLGMIGEITDEGKKTTQQMIEQTHDAFRAHVLKSRPVLEEHIEEVGNGHVWLGVDALKLKLIDAVKTSDEYIEEKLNKSSRVLKLVALPSRPSLLFGPGQGISGSIKSNFIGLVHSIGNSLKAMIHNSSLNNLFCFVTPTEASMPEKE